MSLDWHNRYNTGQQPERTLRQMTSDDIPGVAALAKSVGWAQGERDFERVRQWEPEGCFCIEEQDQGIIGSITTTTYDTQLAWIGMVIVEPNHQRQGLGKQLMRAALDYLITRDLARIMLDSSDVGRTLYEQMGFRKVCKVERWEGRASTYLGPRARRMREADLDAVITLDSTLFGIARPRILKRLWDEFPSMAWVDESRGEIEGFLMGHRVADTVSLGPWMSWTAASAERLLRIAFEQLQGEQIVMNLPDQNGRGLLIVRNHNLKRVRHCTRMIYGDAHPLVGEPLSELAIASLATG